MRLRARRIATKGGCLKGSVIMSVSEGSFPESLQIPSKERSIAAAAQMLDVKGECGQDHEMIHENKEIDQYDQYKVAAPKTGS